MTARFQHDPYSGKLPYDEMIYQMPPDYQEFREYNPEYVDQNYVRFGGQGDYEGAGMPPEAQYILRALARTPHARTTRDPRLLQIMERYNPTPLNYSEHTGGEGMMDDAPRNALNPAIIRSLISGQ